MAFLIKLGSMTVVVPTASEAVEAFDKLSVDGSQSDLVIRTIDGAKVEIQSLRSSVSSTPEP